MHPFNIKLCCSVNHMRYNWKVKLLRWNNVTDVLLISVALSISLNFTSIYLSELKN